MTDFAAWLQGTAPSVALQSTPWAIPVLQTTHILMIGIVLGSVLILALRVLGRVRTDQPFVEVLDRFAPWLWSALLVNLATGLLLTLAEPVREFTSSSYWAKMALILVGAGGALAFRRSLGPRAALLAREPRFSAGQRLGAAATILLWLAVIVLGGAIAYDIEVWGPLSLATRA